MYTINLPDVAGFNLANARRFVEFWSEFYGYEAKVVGAKDQIDYLTELNTQSDLTEENVRRLLRWKDPHYLTDPILSGPDQGKPNKKVKKVLESLGLINHFRHDQITQDEIQRTAAQVFPNGIVWEAFLLHIAKPHTYPIADQNVFRAWSLHTGSKAGQTWETYAAYCNYFWQITEAVGITRTLENIRQLKRVDNALFAFGQFLKAYYSPTVLTVSEPAQG
jgi:hypothetical protein